MDADGFTRHPRLQAPAGPTKLKSVAAPCRCLPQCLTTATRGRSHLMMVRRTAGVPPLILVLTVSLLYCASPFAVLVKLCAAPRRATAPRCVSISAQARSGDGKVPCRATTPTAGTPGQEPLSGESRSSGRVRTGNMFFLGVVIAVMAAGLLFVLTYGSDEERGIYAAFALASLIFGSNFWQTLDGRETEKKKGQLDRINKWHYHMLRDDNRNEFYWRAMETRVLSKKVLVVGSGSGILEMMAAKRGAACVVGLEELEDLQVVASRNVLLNSLDDVVSIRAANSLDFSFPSGDELADVLVSEIMSSQLLGEDIPKYLSDARQRLLKPGGVMIPAAASVHVTLVQSEYLWNSHTVDAWRDIRLQGMNVFTNTERQSTLPDSFYQFPFAVMAPRMQLYNVDMYKVMRDSRYSGAARVVAAESGHVHAIIVSWEAYSDEAGQDVMSTHIDSEDAGVEEQRQHRRAHWPPQYFLTAERKGEAIQPFFVEKGDELVVEFDDYPEGGLCRVELKRATFDR